MADPEIVVRRLRNATGVIPTQADGNSTGNDTIQFYEFYRTPQLVFMTLLLIVILIGNGSLLIAIFLSKKWTRMNFFIVHLAIADILAGVGNLLPDLIWKFTMEWKAGYVECKLIKLIQGTVTFGATYVLVAMSIDRFDAIARPLNFRGSGNRSLVLITMAWSFSLLFSIPMAVLYDTKEMQGLVQCWLLMNEMWWKVYMTLISVALFIAPTIIIALCYMFIVVCIWSRSSSLSTPSSTPSKRNNGTPGSVYSRDYSDESQPKSQGLIPKAKIKTIKMTLVIVLVFVLCWSPYFVFDLLDVYGMIPYTQKRVNISIFIQSLAPLNSAANPFIYCMFSNNFCANWRRLRCCDSLLSCLCPKFGPKASRLPSFRSSSTGYYTVSDGDNKSLRGQKQSRSTNQRRNSGTPVIRANLSIKENQILMRHLSPSHKYTSGSDSTIDSGADSMDGLIGPSNNFTQL